MHNVGDTGIHASRWIFPTFMVVVFALAEPGGGGGVQARPARLCPAEELPHHPGGADPLRREEVRAIREAQSNNNNNL